MSTSWKKWRNNGKKMGLKNASLGEAKRTSAKKKCN